MLPPRSFAIALLCATFATPATAQMHHWAQGQQPKTLAAEATQYCVLTAVRGKFRGYGERVELSVAGGFWRLGGASAQEGVSAEAYCFPRTNIGTVPNGVRWLSPQYDAAWPTELQGCVSVELSQEAAWWGDAATAITGVGGSFRGSGSRCGSTSPSTRSTRRAC